VKTSATAGRTLAGERHRVQLRRDGLPGDEPTLDEHRA
jgi:hypothetical protein